MSFLCVRVFQIYNNDKRKINCFTNINKQNIRIANKI